MKIPFGITVDSILRCPTPPAPHKFHARVAASPALMVDAMSYARAVQSGHPIGWGVCRLCSCDRELVDIRRDIQRHDE